MPDHPQTTLLQILITAAASIMLLILDDHVDPA